MNISNIETELKNKKIKVKELGRIVFSGVPINIHYSDYTSIIHFQRTGFDNVHQSI